MSKDFKVYFLLNKKKEPVYCGTTRRSLSRRYAEHMFSRSLDRKEYSIELIKENLTIEEATILEQMMIKNHSLIENGFNVSKKSQGTFIKTKPEKVEELKPSIKRGRPVSDEHAEKNRTARLGYKNSEEHTKRIVEKTSKAIICVETGVVYSSARQAAKELNLNYTKISAVCNGHRFSTGGLHFKFYKIVEANRND